jgi:hypothetical protein
MSDAIVSFREESNVLRDFDTLAGALLVRAFVKAVRAEGHNEGIVMHIESGYQLAPHVIQGIWPAANRALA